MSNNPRIIKDGQIITNDWQIVTEWDGDTAGLPEGSIIVSLEIWQTAKESLSSRTCGIWLRNDQNIQKIISDLDSVPIIAIDFPTFMDGRGFSIARLLRDRYQYQGEIRATGGIIRDQLCYLRRCGFNAFDLDESIDIDSAVTSLNDFSDGYQASTDQKTPLFRRRA